MNKVKIKCLNMPYVNSTLVTTGNYKGKRITFIIEGKQIANDILNNKNLQKKAFNTIKKKYNTYTRLANNYPENT